MLLQGLGRDEGDSIQRPSTLKVAGMVACPHCSNTIFLLLTNFPASSL